MGNAPGTALARLDEYSARDYNILRPVIDVVGGGNAISPYLVESVAMLAISPADEANETYHDFRYANERDNLYALTSLALSKIASAAGIKWIPELCRIVDRERLQGGHLYVAFQAGAGIRQPNGEWHVETAIKEIDTADEAERIEEAYRRKLKAGRAKYSEADIPDMVRREILQLKEHAMAQAETKAKSRAIRRILSLKQVYSKDELARPFVVPRLLYRPDLADPLAIEQVQVEGRRAATTLYGEASSPSTEQVGALEFNFPGRASPDALPPAGDSRSATDVVDAGAGAGPAEGGSEKGKAPATSQGDTHPPSSPAPPSPPTVDPTFETGPHKGKSWSWVAEHHPDYLRAELEHTRAKAKRELMQGWLDWFTPRLAD